MDFLNLLLLLPKIYKFKGIMHTSTIKFNAVRYHLVKSILWTVFWVPFIEFMKILDALATGFH